VLLCVRFVFVLWWVVAWRLVCRQAMTPVHKVFFLREDDVLDYACVANIFKQVSE
jgi:hypothetical protein